MKKKLSGIGWTDFTANPVIGCDKVSPGCAHCYAQFDTPARVLRAGAWPGMNGRRVETWGPQGERYLVKGFEQTMLALNRRPWVCGECGTAAAFENPFPFQSHQRVRCGGCGEACHRARVFVNSNCDWLDPRWPVATLAHFLDVLRRCPDLTLIACTKRPELWLTRLAEVLADFLYKHDSMNLWNWVDAWINGTAPQNLWLLTSVENQEQADRRIPELLKIPAAVRGLSLEPLLEKVDLTDHLLRGSPVCDRFPNHPKLGRKLHWCIVGGESSVAGRSARPCDVDWIRLVGTQCRIYGVPVYVKQLGSNPKMSEADMEVCFECFEDGSEGLIDPKGADPTEWPDDLRVREWPEAA